MRRLLAGAVALTIAAAGAAEAADPLPERAFRDYWAKIAVNPPPATRFAVEPGTSVSGRDAYRVQEKDGVLSFVGSNVRSLHYAVYDFFRRKGCRWYWDEDALPAKSRVETAGTDIREESRFEYRGLRYFAHRGLTRFQAEHWGPEDWKREIDWCLKNRLNLLMPRIGMDDTWQKAYPDIVPYPDAAKRLPGAGKGYNDRSLFWSLEYRGRLRKEFTDYAFARGLLMPTDFGTMTHWYSRTPQEYLDKVKPAFLPQASKSYGEPSGLVFDVRDPKWYDAYWSLSEAYMKAGYGRPDLMHTIGLGERMVYTNRADNLALKIGVMTNLCNRVAKAYPDSKVLLAGWDFYFSWKPHEVRALLPRLDPSRTVVWDYEADARDDDYDWMGGGGSRRNDFTRWDVIGKFPYVFGIFLCYESGVDIRLDYDLVAKRQALVADDPMCKGYILWPESSHTDILALEYFTANCWSGRSEKVPALLHDLCVRRYGADAAAMEKAWTLLLPMTSGVGWGENCVQQLTGWLANYSDEPHYFPVFRDLERQVAAVPAVYAALKEVSFGTPAVRRDALDVARTACDRMNLYWRGKLFRAFDAWTRGEGDEATVRTAAAGLERESARLADLLALHTDYSIHESYLRLDAVEKIRNPDFGRTLLDNATTPYCRSHQYEMVRHWYLPLARRFTDEIRRRLASGERKSLREDPLPKRWNDEFNKALLATPLETLRPTSPRTREAFCRALSMR